MFVCIGIDTITQSRSLLERRLASAVCQLRILVLIRSFMLVLGVRVKVNRGNSVTRVLSRLLFLGCGL